MGSVERTTSKSPKEKRSRTSSFLRKDSMRFEKIYLVTFLFLSSGICQMALTRTVNFNMRGTVPVASFMWMVISLVCLILMVYTELFNTFPINWTLGCVTVESMTLCVICCDWATIDSWWAGGIVLTVLVINVIVYTVASCCPLCYIPNYKVMLMATIVFIVGYILIVTVGFAINMLGFLVIIYSWTFLYMILMSLYGGSLVHNRRVIFYRSEEFILSATMISSFVLYMIHLLLAIVNNSWDLKRKYGGEHF